MNSWTMYVENLGKIKCAKIEIAPMTLFVGDNNSGKSYIMTLIYGLINVDFYYNHYKFNEQSKSYMKCINFIDRIYNNADTSIKRIELTYEETKAFESVLNELLFFNKDRFIRDLFNKKIDIGNLVLEFKKDNKYALCFESSLTSEHEEFISLFGVNTNERVTTQRSCCVIKGKPEDNQYNFLLSYIIEYMIKENFLENGVRHSTYFPTARTGYILTYKSLIGSALKDKFNLNATQKNLLTRPNSDFLTKLSGITQNNFTDDEWHMINSTQPAVNIIENNIISGQISVSDMPAQDILYHPHGTDALLPMFVTSGVVTEMTPLLLFFRNDNIDTVLIEEPEISLHPQLQVEMARVLIRLVNSKIPVFVTTHSDIILQHINNMIKLAEAANREAIAKKLGYEECDWIDKKKINVYQFNVDDKQETVVTKLPCGDFGFEAMTFYNTLEKLTEQINIIEEE